MTSRKSKAGRKPELLTNPVKPGSILHNLLTLVAEHSAKRLAEKQKPSKTTDNPS